MRLLATAAALACGSLLLGAGLEKARHLPSFAATLRELGVRRGAILAAAVVVAMEIAVAIGVVFRPDSLLTIVGVIALAASFAIAGLVALRQGRRVLCNCFGLSGDSVLGKKQLRAFPLWLAGAALLALQPPPDAWRPALFAAVGLTLAVFRVRGAVHEALLARGDRRSAKEMYAWLP